MRDDIQTAGQIYFSMGINRNVTRIFLDYLSCNPVGYEPQISLFFLSGEEVKYLSFSSPTPIISCDPAGREAGEPRVGRVTWVGVHI